MSASVEQIERPLMTPDEVMRLKPPRKAGTGASEGSPPWRHAYLCQRPPPHLRDTDPLFRRSVLLKRAAIVPPISFVAIEEGDVVPSGEPIALRAVISRAELAQDTTKEAPVQQNSMSVMERAFIGTDWKQ